MVKPMRSRRASEELFRGAFAAYGAELYGFALRTLASSDVAEEAVQETLLRAWRAADRFDPEIAPIRAWLFAILRNVVVDLSRSRAVSLLAAAAEEQSRTQQEDQIEKRIVAWHIEEALRRISDHHRRVLLEVYYRARPYAEVAEELRIPEGTVKSRIYYGLKALRLALEEMGWSNG
jgi:RNA polymerase sigma-70 factor (ECF subfamily)